MKFHLKPPEAAFSTVFFAVGSNRKYSDVISSFSVRQTAWIYTLNLVILTQTVHEIKSCESVGCGIFDRFVLNFDNCQPEVVSDVISGMTDQNVSVDVCANFRDFRLKPSEASFSAPFRTSVTSDRKYIVTSYPALL